MFWETRWPLILGFSLSGSVQAFVSRHQMEREKRVWSRVSEPPRNCALITAPLFGLAWTRHILRVEPVASADPEELALWVGASIDTFLESRRTAEPGDRA